MMMHSYQGSPNLVISFLSNFESGNKLYTKAVNAVNGENIIL